MWQPSILTLPALNTASSWLKLVDLTLDAKCLNTLDCCSSEYPYFLWAWRTLCLHAFLASSHSLKLIQVSLSPEINFNTSISSFPIFPWTLIRSLVLITFMSLLGKGLTCQGAYLFKVLNSNLYVFPFFAQPSWFYCAGPLSAYCITYSLSNQR